MKKRVWAIMLALAMTVSLAAGCAGKKDEQATTEGTTTGTTTETGDTEEVTDDVGIDTSEEVEIILYMIGDRPADYDKMLEEFNKKAKADLNCTLKVNFLTWGEYRTKYPLILSSGEPIDLIYVATWLNFYPQAQKGAFLPIEDILEKSSPNTYSTITEAAMRQATVNGHVYAVSGTKESYNSYGPVVRKDLMEKYGMDKIDTFDKYGDFLKEVSKNEQGMDPTFFSSVGSEFDATYMMMEGLYPLTGNMESIYWIDPTEASPQVISVESWEKTPEFLAKMKEWSDEGTWSKSALANKDTNKLQNGTSASRLKNLDTWIEATIGTDWEWEFFDFAPQVEIMSHMQDSIAVPASSKNPERALLLLDKIKSDESYYRLMTYGIEGDHYEIHADGSIESIASDRFGFRPGMWGMEMREFMLPITGSPEALAGMLDDYHKSAVDNIYRGFYMDSEPFKNELAAVQSVMEQYWNPLELGYVDPVSGYQEFQEQMKAAGNDKVLEELQKQVDAFTEANR